MTPKVDRPGPRITYEVFDASIARVAALPPEQQSAAIEREAAGFGISPGNWRSRRSKRRTALKGSGTSPRPEGVPSVPPDLLARARLAAAGEAGEQPPTGEGDGPAPSGSIGGAADQLSPEFVVAASVFVVERVGRIFGAMYKLPPAAVVAVSKVSEEEKQQLRDAAPLAMPWIRKQLALADDTAGLNLYLFALVSIGWSKVDTLGTVRAMKAAQERAATWSRQQSQQETPSGPNGPPSPIEPSEILAPLPAA